MRRQRCDPAPELSKAIRCVVEDNGGPRGMHRFRVKEDKIAVAAFFRQRHSQHVKREMQSITGSIKANVGHKSIRLSSLSLCVWLVPGIKYRCACIGSNSPLVGIVIFRRNKKYTLKGAIAVYRMDSVEFMSPTHFSEASFPASLLRS